MKRSILVLLTAATLAGAGCLGLDKPLWEHDKADAKVPQPAPLPPTPPVSPDSITGVNAVQKASDLAAELSRAEGEPAPTAAAPQKP